MRAWYRRVSLVLPCGHSSPLRLCASLDLVRTSLTETLIEWLQYDLPSGPGASTKNRSDVLGLAKHLSKPETGDSRCDCAGDATTSRRYQSSVGGNCGGSARIDFVSNRCKSPIRYYRQTVRCSQG